MMLMRENGLLLGEWSGSIYYVNLPFQFRVGTAARAGFAWCCFTQTSTLILTHRYSCVQSVNGHTDGVICAPMKDHGKQTWAEPHANIWGLGTNLKQELV